MKPVCRLLCLLLLTCSFAQAQQFGAFPPSTRWKQIDNDTARVIFSRGADWQASRIATLIRRAAADTPLSLGAGLRKVNVVLHNRTTLANGYVALGPFRSEFYLVPGFNLFDQGNTPWYEQLALHEYRHVQQYNNFRHGLSKGFYYLFGEQGLALANAMTVPDWFFEGDAVHTETALSRQGRGRLPYFLSGYNSLWLQRKNYSWQKLRNGSLKDYVPSHYQLGYLLANYGYLTYGDEFWKNVTRDASAFKGLFYPFQKAIRRYAGVDYKTFRNQAFDFYRKQLGEARDSNLIDNRTVTSYHYPQYIGQDSLLYLKTGYNRLPVFFIRRGNREQRLGMQSISSEEWFSYRSGKIAYTALATNARWSLVNYSDLVLFDLSAHKEKRLSRHKRYYTPDLSPSGERLAAVCLTDSLRSELHVLRSDDGSLIRRFELEHPGDLFAQPRFVDEERVVVSRRTADARMELLLFSLADGSREVLVPATHHTISLPYVAGNTVYFTAGFHKNDDIYAVDLTGKTVKRLTTGFTGHYFPSVYKDTLVWSHFTANGLELRKAALSSLSGETVSLAGEEAPALFPVAFPRNLLSVETQRFASKRYNKGKGLFNFHSWNPSYNDPEFTFSLYSDNILNTFSNEIFYRYNQNERSNTVGWNTSYGGFFPQINAGAEYTFDRTIRTTARSIDLSQFEARIGYNIPLNITRGKTYRFLNFGSNYVYNKATVKGIYKDSFDLRGVSYLHHFLGWSHYLPMAVQHIYPRFGYTLSGAHRHLLNDDGFQFFGLAQLFLPSVRNHSIVLAGSWQETDTLNTTFSNRFAFSRGYVDFYFSRMRRFSANYHFPIAYPDFGIASIVYFQRLRGNLFYDFTRVFSADKRQSADLRSVGGELFFDTRWWNQQPVSFGLRLSYLLDRGFSAADTKGSYYFEFVLPVNLIPD